MNTYIRAAILFACAGCSPSPGTPHSVRADAADTVVALSNGVVSADLVGDGTPARATVVWRDNFNAHGFSAVEFSAQASTDDKPPQKYWSLVPLFGQRDSAGVERDLFRTEEGADCTLGDLRVITPARQAARLVLASRELGETYADPAAVRFDFYRLKKNSEGMVGRPLYYFEYERSQQASKSYCDVNEAFQRELGLGRHGLGHSDATAQASARGQSNER